LFEKGNPIDFVSVSNLLTGNESANDPVYLTKLAESMPSAANIDYYSKIVEEKALLRRLIHTSSDIMTSAFTREDEVEGVIDEAERNILAVSSRQNTQSFKAIKDVLIGVYDNIETLYNAKDDVTGIPTGYRDLDRMTSGFQPNDLIIIAARPSMGKTAFALNIAQNVATGTDENVAIF